MWDLPYMQQASYLEGGPLMWMLPLYMQVNQKSDDDNDDEDGGSGPLNKMAATPIYGKNT